MIACRQPSPTSRTAPESSRRRTQRNPARGSNDQRNSAAFVNLLRDADADLEDAAFEGALADVLRAEPQLTDLWATWSSDQRWTPSAFVNGREAGWYDSGYHHVRLHADEAAAVADFVHRMTAWLARREVIAVET